MLECLLISLGEMPIFWNVIKLIFGRSSGVEQVTRAERRILPVACHSSLFRKVFLHSVVLVSCTPSTCVLQMYFLLSLGHVGVALGTDWAGWLGGLERRTVHLQPPQITAPEAALIHDSCLGRSPTARAVPRGLVEIKAPVSTHELESIHQLSPAEGLGSRRGRAGEGEQAQGQIEEMRGGCDWHLHLLQEITKAALK